MKYLIDTHICLWALFEDDKLSSASKSILTNRSYHILVSQVSLYEIAIKHQVGKLPELKVDFILRSKGNQFHWIQLVTYFQLALRNLFQ